MKWSMTLSLAALLFTPQFLPADHNTGFNHTNHGWSTWKPAKAKGTFSWTKQEGSAQPGAVMISAGPDNKVKGALVYNKHFPGYAGKKYRASVMVKTEGLPPDAVISLTFQGKGFKQDFLGTKMIGVYKKAKDFSDKEWKKLDFDFQIPTTGKWQNTGWLLCCIGLAHAPQGKVYFDDFCFSPAKIPVDRAFKLPEKSDRIQLISNGKAEAAIIIPDSPLPVYPLAAEEFNYHLKRVSGTALPVYRESQMPSDLKKRIFIGPCQQTEKQGLDCESLPPSGYVVCGIKNDLFIAGRDRSLQGSVGSNWYADWQGSLFGVYALCRNELGIRWIFPGDKGVVAPVRKTIVYSGKVYTGKPKLMSSRLMTGSWNWIGWQDLKAREKFLANEKRFLLRHGFQSVENVNYSHNFGNYWKRFSKKHPEYFALVNPGNRKQLKGDSNSGIQIALCLSNPGFQDQAVKDWISRPQSVKMVRPYLSVMLNDTPEMCICENCRKWDYPDPRFKKSEYWGKGKVLTYHQRWRLSTAAWGEDGADGKGEPSLSDRYARFCLAVQEKARALDPDVTLIGFAYTNYVHPPKAVKLNKGIIIQNVFGLWYPYTLEMSQKFRKNWLGWNKAGVRQMFRPNLLHAGGNLPIFYGRRFAEDFRWAYQNGMTASDLDSLTGSWAAQNPNLYVICRMHDDPDLSCDEIIEEYVNCFGKAAPFMRKYVAFLEKCGNELTREQNQKFRRENSLKGRIGGGFQNYALIAHEITPLKNLAYLKTLLTSAEEAVKDSPAILEQIAFLKKGLQDAELTVKTRLAQIEMQKKNTPENKAKFLETFKTLQAFRKDCEHEGVLNNGKVAFREYFGCNWPWKDNRKRGKKK